MSGSDYARRNLDDDLEDDLEASALTAPAVRPVFTSEAPAVTGKVLPAVPPVVRKVAARASASPTTPVVVFDGSAPPVQLPIPRPAPRTPPGVGASGCLCSMPPELAAKGITDVVVRYRDGHTVRYSTRFSPGR